MLDNSFGISLFKVNKGTVKYLTNGMKWFVLGR